MVAAPGPEVEVSLVRRAISGRDGSNTAGAAPPVAAYAGRMATEQHGAPQDRILRVGQVSGSRWTVSVGDDPTPLSEHRTRSEAEAAARSHAETFGFPEILVYPSDGEQATIIIDDEDPDPGFPAAPR
jgi:hypothetical protein